MHDTCFREIFLVGGHLSGEMLDLQSLISLVNSWHIPQKLQNPFPA